MIGGVIISVVPLQRRSVSLIPTWRIVCGVAGVLDPATMDVAPIIIKGVPALPTCRQSARAEHKLMYPRRQSTLAVHASSPNELLRPAFQFADLVPETARHITIPGSLGLQAIVLQVGDAPPDLRNPAGSIWI
jgi:hypothetical protein